MGSIIRGGEWNSEMSGHAFRSGGLSYPAIVCRLFRAGGPGFLLWGCCGVFSVPLEKTVIFLTAPESQDYAALSSLSDKRQPTESRCARSFGCVGGILVFRDC